MGPAKTNGGYVDRRAYLGQGVIGEWDHVRFGIRENVDVVGDVVVKGAKAHPPTFTPFDAVKPPAPESGRYYHQQFAHIYRFDYDSNHPFWDEGYSPSHAFVYQRDLSDGAIDNYDLDSDFFIRGDEGPKGRRAVRLGPGATLEIPVSKWDNYAFNGTGSMDPFGGSLIFNKAERQAFEMLDNSYFENVANSHLAWGTFVKPHKLPNGSDISDVFAIDLYPAEEDYGKSQFYAGYNSEGYFVCGTRRAFEVTPNTALTLGPFTGGQLQVGQWDHVGVDIQMDLQENSETRNAKVYFNGVEVLNQEILISNAGAVGPGSGNGFGFRVDDGQNAVMRVGGVPPSMFTNYYWKDYWTDFSISEMFVAYPSQSGQTEVDFARLAATGGVAITGHSEVAYAGANTRLGYVVGTGNGASTSTTGVFTYPATTMADAGRKMLWVTAAGGNDWEGPLKGGAALYGNGTFRNAESYYAIYQGDSVAEKMGSTDSPIQLGALVPDNGVNLALIANKEWSSDTAVTAFDMSDENFNNVTNKLHGDFTLTFNDSLDNTQVGDPNQWSAIVNFELDSPDIRLTSFTIADTEIESEHAAYFTHLIGGDDKGVYIPSAVNHDSATGVTGNYLLNLEKVKDAVTVRTSDGQEIPFETFPFDVIVTPYDPNKDISALTGNDVLGFGPEFDQTLANPNGMFTVMLVAEKQSIGDSVFIHYPSINRENGNIFLDDSEVYNPVPLMKELVDYTSSTGRVIPQTGYYSIVKHPYGKGDAIGIWGGSTDV